VAKSAAYLLGKVTQQSESLLSKPILFLFKYFLWLCYLCLAYVCVIQILSAHIADK